jgi:hypothetical protein
MIGWPVQWQVRLKGLLMEEGTQLRPSGQHMPGPARAAAQVACHAESAVNGLFNIRFFVSIFIQFIQFNSVVLIHMKE